MEDRSCIERMLEVCASSDHMVKECLEKGDITIDEFLNIQAGKAKKNNEVTPLRSSEDIKAQAVRMTAKLIGDEAADGIRDALDMNAICTADHHGAIFCAQSFQGDILFSILIKKLGNRGRYVPIFSASQVELENATYARGICAYSSPEDKLLFPLFPAKYSVTLASHADPVNRDMTARFRKRFIEGCETRDRSHDAGLKNALDTILRSTYESAGAMAGESFVDQASLAGAALSDLIFPGDDGLRFVYLENEEIIKPALYEELHDRNSIIARILYDDKTRIAFVDTVTDDDISFGGLLFRSVDEKGRKILLSLTKDGRLEGRDWHGLSVTYDTDPDTLTELMEKRLLIPGIFTCALISFFERGITWYGGMFQSCYLPVWQRDFTRFLAENGMKGEADVIGAYDCKGYISGPMFRTYSGDGFTTCAGPVEFISDRVNISEITNETKRITLGDAHRIGLSEMYFDLAARDEREENWYRNIAAELGRIVQCHA